MRGFTIYDLRFTRAFVPSVPFVPLVPSAVRQAPVFTLKSGRYCEHVHSRLDPLSHSHFHRRGFPNSEHSSDPGKPVTTASPIASEIIAFGRRRAPARQALPLAICCSPSAIGYWLLAIAGAPAHRPVKLSPTKSSYSHPLPPHCHPGCVTFCPSSLQGRGGIAASLSEKPSPLGFSSPAVCCSLSLGEKVRVRAIQACNHIATSTRHRRAFRPQFLSNRTYPTALLFAICDLLFRSRPTTSEPSSNRALSAEEASR